MKPYLNDALVCQCCLNEDQSQFTEKFVKNDLVVLECNRCSFNFIPWYYRKNISYASYKDDAVLQQIRQGNNWIKIQRHLLRFRLIRKFIKTGRLFDLGSGWGHFLLTGKQLGYDVYGIEVATNPYNYSKEDLGLPVDHVDFFDLKKEAGSFDLITLWDVLEHIDNASAVIEKCACLLSDGGYIVIQVPQIDSFIATRRKEKWNMMGLDHVNYFSRKTITHLLNRHGFKVETIRSSIELKLLLMYTILPWINKLKKKKETTISSSERQAFYNKTTRKPMWMLKIMVLLHNMVYNTLSFLNVGEEMVVVARKEV